MGGSISVYVLKTYIQCVFFPFKLGLYHEIWTFGLCILNYVHIIFILCVPPSVIQLCVILNFYSICEKMVACQEHSMMRFVSIFCHENLIITLNNYIFFSCYNCNAIYMCWHCHICSLYAKKVLLRMFPAVGRSLSVLCDMPRCIPVCSCFKKCHRLCAYPLAWFPSGYFPVHLLQESHWFWWLHVKCINLFMLFPIRILTAELLHRSFASLSPLSTLSVLI